MKKEEIEKHISGLSPELQEKARACQSVKELYELIAENDVELSDDALEAIAGGCTSSEEKYKEWVEELYEDYSNVLHFYNNGVLKKAEKIANNKGTARYVITSTTGSFTVEFSEYSSTIRVNQMTKVK